MFDRCGGWLKHNTMNTITRILVLLITLLILPQNSVQAGFYDWLVSKDDSNDILVQTAEDNRTSLDYFYRWTRSIEEAEKKEIKVLKTYTVRATGYSSTPDQTDSTPFITASGTYVRDGIIAANVYANGRRIPFGTLIRIPEVYGDKIFVVEDRMHARYKNNIDIWFPERQLAREFGSKKVTIEIVEES